MRSRVGRVVTMLSHPATLSVQGRSIRQPVTNSSGCVVGALHVQLAGCLVAAAAGVTMAVAVPAASAVARPVTCDGLRATIVGTRGADTIVGTPGRDVIAARSGWDTVRARGGNDVICGADGSDSLMGGLGDDRVFGGRGAVVDDRTGRHLRNDTLRGGPGDDLIVGGRDNRDLPSPLPDMVDFSAAVRGMDVDLDTGVAVGQGRDVLSIQSWFINGSDHDDRLIGSAFRDYLDGGLGADYLAGRGGPDTIIGDVMSNSGDFSPDVVRGQGGDDFLSTWGGQDVQYGGPGDDELSDWGASPDRLYGQGDDDKITDGVVPGAGQVLSGGPGRNEVDLRTRSAEVSGVMDLRIGETTVDLAHADGRRDLGFHDGTRAQRGLDLLRDGRGGVLLGEPCRTAHHLRGRRRRLSRRDRQRRPPPGRCGARPGPSRRWPRHLCEHRGGPLRRVRDVVGVAQGTDCLALV